MSIERNKSFASTRRHKAPQVYHVGLVNNKEREFLLEFVTEENFAEPAAVQKQFWALPKMSNF